jgi:hypothetical protein
VANWWVLVSFMNFDFIPSCAKRVAVIADGVCRAVGHSFGRGLMQAVMTVLVFQRIKRAQGLLLALLERVRASGRVRRVLDAAPRAVAVRPDLRDRVVPETMRLPRRFAWLCVLVPGEAACYAGQLQAVLAEPGMAELLAHCPQAVRILRPLCWMLGIERADWVPGVARAPKAARAVRAKRVRVVAAVVAPVWDAAREFTGLPLRHRLKYGLRA